MKNVKRNLKLRLLLTSVANFAFCATLALCSTRACCAAARLPSIFADNMILQQNAKTIVWGTANPNESVTVEINEAAGSAVANFDGIWRVELPAQKAGGPYDMTVRAENTIVYKNVWFGEVWLCCGQSNASFPLKRAARGKEESATATYPQLRFFTVPQRSAEEPQRDFSAKWEPCSPKTCPDVSALAYYFGQYLHEKLQAPVGVVVAAWSGSTCEAWVERSSLAKFPELEPLLDPDRLMRASPGQRAGALYNGMIAPLVPFAIKGVVWYQGESNANRAWQYRALFPTLISSWREKWGQGDFPFYYIQLPNFMAAKSEPSASAWAELREAQHKALSARNVGEVVTIDLGDANNLHPKNKEDFGRRLANLALAKTYDFDAPYSGPIFKSFKVVDSRAFLSFDSVDGELKIGENPGCDSSELRGFAVAGADRVFHWAEASIIDDGVVVVSSPEVAKPIAVRYAWADNPICNLTNASGLPASPFRTDDWPGATVDAR